MRGAENSLYHPDCFPGCGFCGQQLRPGEKVLARGLELIHSHHLHNFSVNNVQKVEQIPAHPTTQSNGMEIPSLTIPNPAGFQQGRFISTSGTSSKLLLFNIHFS